jgi:PAS domain S-box-containing protein
VRADLLTISSNFFHVRSKTALLDSLAIGMTLSTVMLVEGLTHLGIAVPAPFLLISVVVILSASVRGLRVGIVSASIWAVYIVYESSIGAGPKALTGGGLQVGVGITLIYCATILQGAQKEQNKRLLKELRSAYQDLGIKFDARTSELARLRDQRRHAEAALRESQRRYQTLAEAAPVGIFRTDAIGNCIYVNEKWSAISGLSMEAARGQGWVNGLHPDDREKVAQDWYFAAENNTPFHLEYRFQRFDGSVTWVVGQAVAERDGDGTIVGYVGTITDISDRKAAEVALQESQSFLQAIFERSAVGISVADMHQQLTYVKTNAAFQQMLGYTEAQLHSLSVIDITHPDDIELDHRMVSRLVADECNSIVIEKRYYHQNGTIIWVRVTLSLIRTIDGQPKYSVGIIENITDRKLAEAALQESEERWQLAITGNHDGIWDHNLITNEHFLSDRCYEILGYSPTEIDTFDKWVSYIHPDDVALIKTAFQRHLHQETDYYSCEYRIRNKAGYYVWILARGKAQWDENGTPIRAIGSITDISDRKRAEELLKQAKDDLEQRVIDRTLELSNANALIQQELQERNRVENSLSASEHRWRMLLEEIPLLVASLDLQGHVNYINPHALEVIGYTDVEILDQDWHQMMTPRHLKAHESTVFQEFLRDEKPFPHTATIVTKAGELRQIAWICTIIRNAQGEIVGCTSVGEDVTERLRVEQMKNEFISIVSHELRTPLTSIYSALDLLADGIIPPESERGKRTLAIAADGAERLTRIVNDILDLERLESGKVKVSLQVCQLDDLLYQVAALMQLTADRAGITLSISPLLITLRVEPDRIIQVLTNLLSNAIKFSPQGSTVWVTAQVMEPAVLLITVKDQGRGIPADKLEKIFDRFQQVDASDARSNGGTGLGLAICRSIVQQHDGQIWAESVLGEGSTFCFTLPIQRESCI